MPRSLREAIAAVRADGHHQQIRCPHHDDRQASLSIDAGKNGGVVLKCHAGCDTRAVLEADGLTLADLAPTPNGDGASRALDIVATYKYRDESGRELYQVLRLNPKTFRQRRADGSGKWAWNLDGVRRVLYRLPELADAKTVWMVEGEKDADRLAAAGLVVTTWAGGSTGWKPDYAAQLATAGAQRLIVLADNDEPGKQCARRIVACAAALGIDGKVVELHGLPPKGDVSDWLDAGHTVDELQALCLGDDSPSYGVTLDDFRAHMPDHAFIYIPTRALWPAASVDARLPVMAPTNEDGQPIPGKPIKASLWLAQNRAVEQMTWAPGEPTLIRDRLVAEAGWIDRPGCVCFNLYRAPTARIGRAALAEPWVAHIRYLYPDDAEHIFNWLAHRVQKPQEKINHALVLGGIPGIGKDSLLEPVTAAIGPWNMGDISAPMLLGRFNGFLKSVILRVSEARDLGEMDKYAFYERSKLYTAAPPDVLRIDEKNTREYAIRNVCGVIITTNYKTKGLYLPADDRRHYVAWSDRILDDVAGDYFPDYYDWLSDGGAAHVAAFLHARDLRRFAAKQPPTKTPAFWAIVEAHRAPEDAEMADAIAGHGAPDALTLALLADPPTDAGFRAWLLDRRSSRTIPIRLESAGYQAERNPHAKDGLWVVNRRRCSIYARADLSASARRAAAEALADR